MFEKNQAKMLLFSHQVSARSQGDKIWFFCSWFDSNFLNLTFLNISVDLYVQKKSSKMLIFTQ